jgi:DNA-binding transcriptional LysR family regulator
MKNEPLSWDDLRVLVEVARQRSLLHAGRVLRLSPSTVARRLEALEAALGRKLIHRTTLGTSLEPGAEGLLALAEDLDRQLQAERRDVQGADAFGGVVRVSIKEGFARPVARVVSAWRRAHPETQIELVSEQRVVDLSRREADLALRTVRSSGKTLIEKKLGTFRFGLWAAPSYLERRLRDAHLRPGDFARHDFVGFEGALRKAEQEQWLVAQGATRFPFRSNSDAAILTAAAEGQGVCITVDAFARDTPGLQRVTCELPLPSVSVYLVTHRALRDVPRVRGVMRALEQAVRELAGLG